ncbi:hypothetical protein BURPS1710b_0277 [Burkholderia pseudomallei 1710b]|uniref:Uncharacterized protein n=1 Tax=Burkholderia pseudomallei (strain 1710b) TaxID=320372 RepID=Q3JXL0_BURP1|nr:hypothetical protein BURPS1710b_0277 [Burkholderia pseudomallei 1710b]
MGLRDRAASARGRPPDVRAAGPHARRRQLGERDGLHPRHAGRLRRLARRRLRRLGLGRRAAVLPARRAQSPARRAAARRRRAAARKRLALSASAEPRVRPGRAGVRTAIQRRLQRRVTGRRRLLSDDDVRRPARQHRRDVSRRRQARSAADDRNRRVRHAHRVRERRGGRRALPGARRRRADRACARGNRAVRRRAREPEAPDAVGRRPGGATAAARHSGGARFARGRAQLPGSSRSVAVRARARAGQSRGAGPRAQRAAPRHPVHVVSYGAAHVERRRKRRLRRHGERRPPGRAVPRAARARRRRRPRTARGPRNLDQSMLSAAEVARHRAPAQRRSARADPFRRQFPQSSGRFRGAHARPVARARDHADAVDVEGDRGRDAADRRRPRRSRRVRALAREDRLSPVGHVPHGRRSGFGRRRATARARRRRAADLRRIGDALARVRQHQCADDHDRRALRRIHAVAGARADCARRREYAASRAAGREPRALSAARSPSRRASARAVTIALSHSFEGDVSHAYVQRQGRVDHGRRHGHRRGRRAQVRRSGRQGRAARPPSRAARRGREAARRRRDRGRGRRGRCA